MVGEAKIFMYECVENTGLLLKEYLEAKNFRVDLFTDIKIGYDAFLSKEYDLCIINVLSPSMNGLALGKEIKQLNIEMPVIFLAEKENPENVLLAFRLGADDYITSPFDPEILRYRMKAILNRSQKRNHILPGKFRIGDYTFDSQKRLLYYENNTIELTTKECALLELLCKHMNKVLSRNIALIEIWGGVDFDNIRNMNVYINKLRRILKKDTNVKIINIHGRGYKLISNTTL